MNYNVQQEARVWNRVMGARQEESPEKPSCLSAETVMGYVQDELSGAMVYRHLACRVCPRDRSVLLELAREEQEHARQLSAIYFVLTGKKACPGRVEPPCITCTAEALRQQYLRELEAAEKYRAVNDDRFDHTFRCIAQDESRHARQLLCVIGSSV